MQASVVAHRGIRRWGGVVGDEGAMRRCGDGDGTEKKIARHDIPADQRAQNDSAASWGRRRQKSCRRSSFRPRTCPFRPPLLVRDAGKGNGWMRGAI